MAILMARKRVPSPNLAAGRSVRWRSATPFTGNPVSERFSRHADTKLCHLGATFDNRAGH